MQDKTLMVRVDRKHNQIEIFKTKNNGVTSIYKNDFKHFKKNKRVVIDSKTVNYDCDDRHPWRQSAPSISYTWHVVKDDRGRKLLEGLF